MRIVIRTGEKVEAEVDWPAPPRIGEYVVLPAPLGAPIEPEPRGRRVKRVEWWPGTSYSDGPNVAVFSEGGFHLNGIWNPYAASPWVAELPWI